MKQRIITGILAGALYIAFLLIGSIPFAVFIAAIAVIAFTELAVMKKIAVQSPAVLLGALFVALFVLGACWPRIFSAFLWLRLTAALALLLMILIVFSKNRFHIDQAAHIFFSVFYIGFAFYLLVHLRFDSLLLVFFIQIVIWSTDSGAYFVGRKWGKTKLAPHISPNKTVEGAVGAVIVALIIAALFQLVVREPLFSSWWLLGAATVAVAVFGQLGDLAESAIKRFYQVKDSGKILPGHGGLFDRFDSLIFVLPILYLIHVID